MTTSEQENRAPDACQECGADLWQVGVEGGRCGLCGAELPSEAPPESSPTYLVKGRPS